MLKELPIDKRTESSEVIQQPTREDVVNYATAIGDKGHDCQASCPIGVDIPAVLRHLQKKEFQQARDVISKDNPFPSLCGRACPAPCQKTCSCASHFKLVERFLGDNHAPTPSKIKGTKQRVAIIGAGIAGLTTATMLRRAGVQVKVLEATNQAGGIIPRISPEFKIPAKVMQREIGTVASQVDVATHSIGGAMHPLEELSKTLDAVVVATGANKPAFLGIPGEHLSNVTAVTDYLSSPLKKSKDRTVIIGGTELAFDAARLAKRMGDDVTVIFPKDHYHLSASEMSLRHAQQESVRIMLLTQPVKIVGATKATGIKCAQMMLAESDLDDTKVPVPIEDSEFIVPCDKVIIAAGLEPNPTIARYSPLRTVGKGRLWTNEHLQTNLPNVFAAGEIVLGSTSVDKVITHAKKAADKVLQYLNGEIEEEKELEAESI